jgi:hypothetical protein
MTRDHVNGWACQDCLFLIANGETPEEMTDDETKSYAAKVDVRWTLGRMFGEDGCDHTSEGWHSDPAVQEDHAAQCEMRDFVAYEACDCCGSTLGGSRHAVTMFVDNEEATR